MKKYFSRFAIATLLAIILLFSACNRTEKNTYKIGAAVYGLKGEFMRLWTAALEKHPAVRNKMVEITIFDGNYDASVQYSQFETMISQSYDAILFVPIDLSAGAAAVDIAVAADIPVVGSNGRVNSDKIYSYIGSDDVLSGAMEAQFVIDGMGGAGNLVIIEGPIGQSGQVERLKGNMKIINQYPDIKVIEKLTANWSRAEALALMEDWLNAHPGEIKGVIGQNDEMALGAIEAIKQAGLDVGDFSIAGIDGVTDAIYAVKNDEMTSILQDAVAQAQGSLDLALRAVIGETYEPMAELWKTLNWKDGTEALYNVPWVAITKENADELLAKREQLTSN